MNFFKSIPGIKTLAIAYEDKLYGTDGSKFTQQYAKEAGLDVVMNEPFRAGTPDFSPILNRVKGARSRCALRHRLFRRQPAGGAPVAAARHQAEADRHPGRRREALGLRDAGDNVVVAGSLVVEADDAGPRGMGQEGRGGKRGGEVVSSAVQGYVAMQTLIDAVKAAGKWDRDEIIAKSRLDDLRHTLRQGGLHGPPIWAASISSSPKRA